MSDSTLPPAASTSAAVPPTTSRWTRHLIELATITVGVSIALSLEGVRQWLSDRALAELSSASWTTAELTGAIAHMDYERVRELSTVYEAQELFVEQQRLDLTRLAAATALLSASDDPTRASAEDLRSFRTEVLGLRADLLIQQQLAKRLETLYANVGRAP